MMDRVFTVRTTDWRGFGPVPDSGLILRDAYAHRDAARVFPVDIPSATEPKGWPSISTEMVEITACQVDRKS